MIGSGSGNAVLDDRFATTKVALIDKGDPFGGTCLNAGCLPTKMFVHTADVLDHIRTAHRFGISVGAPSADWVAIRDRIFGRTDGIAEAGLAYRQSQDNLEVLRGTAHFVGERLVEVNYPDGNFERLVADRFVLAAGSRPTVPEVPGLTAVDGAGRIHTSDTIMRIDALPKSLLIYGGGVVASEFAHVFSSLGVQVTVVNRSAPMLRGADKDISLTFTELLSRHVLVRLNQSLKEVDEQPGEVTIYTRDTAGMEYSYTAEMLLLASGRRPNSDLLDLDQTGVAVDDRGFVVVDEYQRTTAPGIWALGDLCSPWLLKHVANHEARVVQHNLLFPDDLVKANHHAIPQAVFSSPQLASVGKTEQELIADGVDYVAGTQKFADVGYGWALEDAGDHFCKVLLDPATHQLLGCHIVGPHASALLQPATQAMATGTDARTLARGVYWIHPALTEVLENALLQAAPDPK